MKQRKIIGQEITGFDMNNISARDGIFGEFKNTDWSDIIIIFGTLGIILGLSLRILYTIVTSV